MIQELKISQYALIETVNVKFAPGLNVLSGETGAGKSILIGALGLLLGNKADVEVIRTGAEEAQVAATFGVEISAELKDWLDENQLAVPEDEALLIRRVVRPQRRGGSFVSGQSVTRLQLEGLTSFLVDLHGQHEHQSLFSSDQHRRLLDRFADLDGDLKSFGLDFQELSVAQKRLDDLVLAEATRESDFKIAEQMIAEIEKIKWTDPEEEDSLKKQRVQMEQYGKLNALLTEVEDSLSDRRGSALGQLRTGLSALGSLSLLDERWLAEEQRFAGALLELEDIADGVHRSHRELQFRPEQLEVTQDRLSVLHSIQKKYNVSGWANLQTLLHQAQSRRDELQSLSTEIDSLRRTVDEQEKALIASAIRLSEKRQAAAKRLESGVKTILSDLGMPGSQFSVGFGRRLGESGKPICTPTGIDQLDFLLSANPGEPLRPLRETASGGELSRVMLALKTLLSEADKIPILIFDEIDTGIGGDIGLALGKYLKRLSTSKQVLCITHLASVASFADHHLKVEKVLEEGRSTTNVVALDREQRVRELARMLSGSAVTEASLEHARALVERHAAKG